MRLHTVDPLEMSHVNSLDIARKLIRKRPKVGSGKRLGIAIAHGMASTSTLYNLPQIAPVKYEIDPNTDLVSIGRDMWRAVETYNDEQI